jgi:alpha-tubulin suppressor-like RCC1 family protein
MEPSSSSNSMFAIGETSSSINEGSWVGFGRNQFGELGLGKTSKAELPTTGSGFSNLFYGENEIVSIVGGDKWSAALTRSSTTGRTRIYVLGNIPTSLWVLGLQVLLDPSTTDTGTSDFKAKHHRYTAFPLPLELDGVEQISSLPSYLVWTSNQQLHMLSMSLPAAVISWPITNTTVLSCGLWDDFGCAVNQTSDFLRLVSPSTPDVPVYSPSPSPFLNMSMGYDFTVVAVAESSGSITLVVTGQNNDKFQLGRNDSASSNNIDVLGDFLIIVSGRYHTLLHNGTDLLSFGSNEQGQVGRQGTALQTCTIDIVPKVSPTTPWTTSIAAIGETSFAVASTGILYAWGANTQSAIMGITTVFSETWQPKIVWNVPTTWHLCNHCAGESMVAHKSGGPRFTSSGPRGNDALISFGRNNHGQLAGHIDDAVGSTLPIFTSLNTQFAPTLPKSSLMGLNDSRYPIGFSAHSGSFIHSASNSHIYYQFSGYDPSDVTIYNTKVPALVMVEVSWVSEGLQTTSVPTIFYHTPGVSGLGSISSGGERLFAVSSDGSSPRVLLDNPGYEPNWNSVTYLGSGGTGIPSFFPSVSNLSPNVFVAAWEDKWYFSGSESFFESKIESVTFSESSQINSILYHNGTLETFNSFGCPSLPQVTQAISANDSRFVMFNDSGLYTCGNSNNFKELGENAQLGIWNLIAYNYHIKQLAALDNTNYMLTTDGKVYAWGLNGPHGLFGMPDCEDDNVIPGTPTCPPDFTGTLTLIQWTVTSPWRLSGVQPYIIKNIFTVPSKLSVHFFAQMRRPEDIEPTTPFAPQAPVTSGAQCPPPRPSPAFTCENGVWTSPSPIVVTPGTEITIGGPSIVQGNVSVEGGGSLVFTLPPIGSGAVLNVNGCITIDGSVIVTLTGDDLKEIDQQSGKSRESILVSAQCGSLSGVTNIAVSAPSDCRKASAQRSGSSDTSLSVVFRVDRSRCDRWWIILVSVLGGVILLVGIISLLVAFTPLKFIVRPFTRRGVKPVMAK